MLSLFTKNVTSFGLHANKEISVEVLPEKAVQDWVYYWS